MSVTVFTFFLFLFLVSLWFSQLLLEEVYSNLVVQTKMKNASVYDFVHCIDSIDSLIV